MLVNKRFMNNLGTRILEDVLLETPVLETEKCKESYSSEHRTLVC